MFDEPIQPVQDGPYAWGQVCGHYICPEFSKRVILWSHEYIISGLEVVFWPGIGSTFWIRTVLRQQKIMKVFTFLVVISSRRILASSMVQTSFREAIVYSNRLTTLSTDEARSNFICAGKCRLFVGNQACQGFTHDRSTRQCRLKFLDFAAMPVGPKEQLFLDRRFSGISPICSFLILML